MLKLLDGSWLADVKGECILDLSANCRHDHYCWDVRVHGEIVRGPDGTETTCTVELRHNKGVLFHCPRLKYHPRVCEVRLWVLATI